ncbi:MAG: helix-turn-helix transcriptional regulator [Terrimicrobiaceae bacterium]
MREGVLGRGRDGPRSLGAQFAAVRLRRGLTLEKVSSETHIRIQRLREIERDDLSRFAHPSYARMFAMDYAKYLGIPISRIRRLLPETGECGTEGYQYLQEAACDYMRTNVRPFRRRKRLARRVAAVALLLLLGVGGLKVWTTIRDIERLGLNRMALEDRAILTVPDVQEAPESLGVPTTSDPSIAPQEDGTVPATEVPISGNSPAEAEAALLVGTDLGQSSHLR